MFDFVFVANHMNQVSSLDILNIFALVAFLGLCCWNDFKYQVIPNTLNYSFALIAFLISAIRFVLQQSIDSTSTVGNIYSSWPSPEQSLLGSGVCLFVTVACWRLGAIGGGDVKLATVVGGFLGPWGGLTALAICHILALVTVTCDLASRHFKTLRVRQLPTAQELKTDLQRQVPMAGFYALGVIGYFFGGVMS